MLTADGIRVFLGVCGKTIRGMDVVIGKRELLNAESLCLS